MLKIILLSGTHLSYLGTHWHRDISLTRWSLQEKVVSGVYCCPVSCGKQENVRVKAFSKYFDWVYNKFLYLSWLSPAAPHFPGSRDVCDVCLWQGGMISCRYFLSTICTSVLSPAWRGHGDFKHHTGSIYKNRLNFQRSTLTDAFLSWEKQT